MGEEEVRIVCIITETANDKSNQTNREYNMQISITNTKAMTIIKKPLRCKLALENQITEQVMSFNQETKLIKQ